MQFWERVLYSSALVSLVFLFFIFSSHELTGLNNSFTNEQVQQEVHSFASVGYGNTELSQIRKEQKESSDVSPEDVLKVLDSYYQVKLENKELAEEEQRLLEEQPSPNEEQQSFERNSNNFAIVKHIVQKGDSLWSIAKKYQVPLYTIESANVQVKNNMIHKGQTIQVPNQAGLIYKVKRGNSLSAIAKRYKTSVDKIVLYNHLQNSKIQVNQQLFLPNAVLPPPTHKNVKMFVMPVKGRITSQYGWRQHPILKKRAFHYGLDIAAPTGTTIKAANAGVVIFSGDGGSYGNMVMLKHKNNYISIYAHASKLTVKKGQYVKRGQKIAEVGNTGLSTGPHLHFEVKRNRVAMDPQLALKKTIRVAIRQE